MDTAPADDVPALHSTGTGVAVGSSGALLREGGARLVPISVRVEHGEHLLADTFLWSLDEQHVTPEVRADGTVTVPRSFFLPVVP
jgi:hypothetical protein